jgi:hypothetical protein
MQAEKHQSWGFVIYRTTYESQADWEECLRRVQSEIADHLAELGASILLNSHVLTILDDREKFNNVDTAAIRQHFKQWVAEAVSREQPDAIVPRPIDLRTYAPRYYYCIQIDAAALESVVNAHPREITVMTNDTTHTGWVKLIDREFQPRADDPRWRHRPPWSPEEAIEGITDPDVGWCKVNYIDLVPCYAQCTDPIGWPCFYKRPPRLANV